jgi:hypothetical protein
MSLPRYTALLRERTGTYTIFVGKPARGHFKDIFVDGNIILKYMFKKYDWVGGWFGMAQSWDKWQAVVNTVMNTVVPLNAGKSLTI